MSTREVHRSSVILEGCRGRFEDFDQFEALPSTSQRLHTFLDAVDEMLALHFERFLLFNMGNVTVPIVIRVLELCEGIVMGRSLDADIVDPKLLDGLEVVIGSRQAAA